jgi:hypothetical protein
MAKFEVDWPSYISDSIYKKLKELKKKTIEEPFDLIRQKTAGKNINKAKTIIAWRKKH